MMKVVFAINLVSSFMFMDLQSGYLLIGLKDSKQTLSNPRTKGDSQNILIMFYLVKNDCQDLHLKSNCDKNFFSSKWNI